MDPHHVPNQDTCGAVGYSFKNCPKTTTGSQAKTSTSGTTALIDLPYRSPPEEMPRTAEPTGELSIRTPLTERQPMDAVCW